LRYRSCKGRARRDRNDEGALAGRPCLHGRHCAAKEVKRGKTTFAFDRLDWDELARWQARATTPGDGLTWETHAGRVPLERLAPLMAPFSALINEQPLGSLEMPRMRYELQGYVSWYEDMDRRGGEHFLVLLRHGDDVAAMCDASWDARFPDRVYQQLTAVARPWRGKGLAKGVKAAMLNLIRARHLEVRTMITTNAEANAPMVHQPTTGLCGAPAGGDFTRSAEKRWLGLSRGRSRLQLRGRVVT
jgi:hypothetical protein